ncbi:MAG: DUF4097 domain-containing protein [Oscillospiraceae bacterium]|jgi:hypothetical protein|nr:DUF4097 domain-containing protein [Oscillospiraceae bacterium]
MIKKTLTKVSVIAIAAGVVMILAAWGLGAQGYVSLGLSGLRVARHGEAETLSQRGITGVKALTVDASGADIEFIPADDFGFDIRTFSGYPDWSLDGGELVVKEARIGGIFRVEFPLLSTLTEDNTYIKIYYPRDGALDKLDISGVSGSIEFPGLDKRVREASFSTVSGNISVAALEADTLKLRTVSGNVEISTATDESSLAYKIDTVSGAVTVGGRRLHGGAESPPAPPGGTSLTISTTSGDVDIEFEPDIG